MQENSTSKGYQKHALFLCILLAVIALGSVLWIVSHSAQSVLPPTGSENNNDTSSSKLLYADIYQAGELKQSILLSTVTESFSFTIYDARENFNEIEVRPGSIGIISASCPDKLCVHQGFIQGSLLPITCLPNRLVIQIRQEDNHTDESKDNLEITPDIITY